MTAQEVLRTLQITRATLTKYVKTGKLKVTVKGNGRYDYDADSVYKMTSIKQSGRNPALFKRIIITAIYALELLINRILKKAKTEADNVADTITEAKPERKDYRGGL